MEPYDYPSVNDYLSMYSLNKVRNIVGWNLRTFEFSGPSPVIKLDPTPDSSCEKISIFPPNLEMSLHIDLKRYLCVINQSLAIINNSLQYPHYFNATEKMSEKQFFYAVSSIKRIMHDNDILLKSLASAMPLLENQLKKEYFPPEVYDNQIVLQLSNGRGYLINLADKEISGLQQDLAKTYDENIIEILRYRVISDQKEFDYVSNILKNELDAETLKSFLKVESRIKLKVRYNKLVEENLAASLFDYYVVNRFRNLSKK